MTNQELFDKVRAYSLTMTEPCVNAAGFCKFRNEKGERCFIGVLIPDELYNSSFDTGFKGEREKAYQAAGVFDQFQFAASLQSIHDCYARVEWPEQFDELAASEGLSA